MIPFKFLSPYREERTSLAVRQLIIHQKEALLLIPVFCCYQITINSIPRVFTYIRKVTLSCVTFHLMQSFSRFRAWKSFCYSHIVGASFCTKTICNDNANISTLTGITCALFDESRYFEDSTLQFHTTSLFPPNLCRIL